MEAKTGILWRTLSAYPHGTSWERTAKKYLDKGKKVCVTGPVRASAYMGQDGAPRASLEMTALEVEFLTPKGENVESSAPAVENGGGYTEVETEEMPF